MLWTRTILLIAVVAATLAGPVQAAQNGVYRQVEGDTTPTIAETPHRAVGFTTSPCGPDSVQVHNTNCNQINKAIERGRHRRGLRGRTRATRTFPETKITFTSTISVAR